MENLRQLDDEQIITACQQLPWEKRLSGFTWSARGCATVLAGVGMVLFGCHILLKNYFDPSRFWPLLSLIGVGLTFITVLKLSAITERRRRHYLRELERRYAGAPLKIYIDEIENDVASRGDEPPEVVIFLTGSALPHGGNWLVQVDLFSTARGEIEMRTLNTTYIDMEEGIRYSKGREELSPQECRETLELADTDFGNEQHAFLPSAVKDGVPATIAIWKRGGGITRRGGCNLTGVPTDKQNEPVVQLMRFIMDLAKRVPRPALLTGSCDSLTGNVRIGHV